MSDSGKAMFPDFGQLVPGFDFLKNLTRQASASTGMPKIPGLGNWVAPTLSVEEIDKRIEELKAVQFWLDQNATALKATVQALEVQKMTLATLQGMNVNMADMAKAFKMPDGVSLSTGMSAASDMANAMATNLASSMASMTGAGDRDRGTSGKSAKGEGASAGEGKSASHHHFAGLEVPETSFMRREQATRDPLRSQAQSEGQASTAQTEAAESSVPGLIDPMQWWGALTQQFQTIANAALQDVSQRKPFEAGKRKSASTSGGTSSKARKSAPARAGATASEGNAKGKTASSRSAKAEAKPARGAKAPKASAAGGRGGKARSSTAAPKAASRSRAR